MDAESNYSMTNPKKLIEVAMPIKEISAESVRDKSIRHGHISTLHLWWARRPLPVCRAVVFASLVSDPLDESCPQSFRDAVEIILGSAKKPLQEKAIEQDAYKPYDDIPYTAAIDQMEDNARNRLLMFIGKYSNEFSANEKAGKTTASGKQLSDASLIKWDNKNNEDIINKARKLIWVSHNSSNDNNLLAKDLLNDFDKHFKAIKNAEQELYSLADRHVESDSIKQKTQNLHNAIEAFLDKMPKVFDPFAGGGAIPLEAARLGCRSFGNDINPVAHIIQKGSLEFPQKYGKPITYTKAEFIKFYDEKLWKEQPQENKIVKAGEAIAVKIVNRLSFDVEFYARKLLAQTENEIGHLYPSVVKGKKAIAYYWVYKAKCSNPSCQALVPLLNQFYLVNKPDKKIFLNPIIKGKNISFEIKAGITLEENWIQRKNLKCPICGNITDINELKKQFNNKEPYPELIAVIEEGSQTKDYRVPDKREIDVLNQLPTGIEFPFEKLPQGNNRDLHCMGWGVKTWGDLFSKRQMCFLNCLVEKFNSLKKELGTSDYYKALFSFLAILIDRIAIANTSFGVWHTGRETLERIMGRQALPFVFDYPESNPFCNSSGSALNQLEWITRYIESECQYPFPTILQNASSGEKTQFPKKFITAVVTDPPYYDAIAYADLSDFFYVWLKRTLTDIFPLNFATPQTPKSEECTALKHYHNGNIDTAKKHFENKLLQTFDAIEHQTSDLVSIMFAHQSTEAWTTLCNSILGARMNITGSWATDTEMTGALKTDKSFLSSSVTVSCKPTIKKGVANFKSIEKEIRTKVEEEVELLYSLGFRGADLLTACFGQAVSIFGKYERVERGDGEEVTVEKLLEIAKEGAFNALLKGFDGDDFTKFYIGWLQLYSFAESDFDDAAKFSRVGLSINVSELFSEHLLIKNGNKQTLATFEERIAANKNTGDRANNFLIDLVHRAMALYKGNNRNALLHYIAKVAAQPENSFWRVITSLCEVLPAGSEDQKQALGLLTNKDSLIRESKQIQGQQTEQTKLFE
jgi:putative DNA methylase